MLVDVFLLLGNKMLFDKQETPPQPFCNEPRFLTSFRFGSIRISQLPLETRIGVNVSVISSTGDNLVIGCACKNLFNANGEMIQGRININLWPFYRIDPRIVSMGEYFCRVPGDSKDIKNCSITLQFDTYSCPVFYSLRDGDIMELLGFERRLDNSINLDEAADSNDLVQVNKILARDPTNLVLTDSERTIIIKARSHLKFLSTALPIFLMAINW